MKRLTLRIVLLLILLPFFGFSQSISQYVISSAGEFQLGKYGKTLHYTLGEPLVDNFENGNILSQGFHQLYQIIVDVDFTKALDYQLTLLPNPTSGRIQLSTESNLKFDVSLFDLYGNEIFKSKSNLHSTDYDISQLAQGIYYLTVSNEKEIIKTFKISKN